MQISSFFLLFVGAFTSCSKSPNTGFKTVSEFHAPTPRCDNPVSYFKDNDGDGFGNEGKILEACDTPAGYVTDGMDCNDNDANIHPDAEEICDWSDNNCNGLVNEDLQCDVDGDGYTQEHDCNDLEKSIFPGQVERINEIDSDCDGNPANSKSGRWYYDADHDDYGDPRIWTHAQRDDLGVIESEGQGILRYVDRAGDCNDESYHVYPGSRWEHDSGPNGIDDDCDGQIDEDWHHASRK